MIDWWGVFRGALWLAGLAVGLAALSLAEYQAGLEGIRLPRKLGERGFQLAPLCLGLLLGSPTWWEAAVWGTLTALGSVHILNSRMERRP